MANLMAVLGVLAALTPLRDPTTPLAGSTPSGGGQPQVAAVALPRLQSIMLGSGPAVAVIGGKGYRQGEQVSGWRIDAITADRVALKKGQERATLTLFADKIIRQVGR